MAKSRKKEVDGIRLEPQCKICRLASTHMDLFQEIHRQMLEDDVPRAQVCAWLNTKVEMNNAITPKDDPNRLAKFNDVNFAKHFANHVAKASKLKQALRKKMIKNGRTKSAIDISRSDLHKDDVDLMEGFFHQLTEELSDYTEITRMVTTLEDLLWRYERETLNPPVPDDGISRRRPVNIGQITQFKNLLKDLADMKLKLAQLRNSSAIAGSAVKRAVAMSVDAFTNIVVSATVEAQESFKEANPDSTVGDSIMETLRNRIGDAVKLSLREIIETTFDEYKIK